MIDEEDPDVCVSCFKPMQVRCPCGKCDLTTNVDVCPTCAPERFAKWSTAHGTNVCRNYVLGRIG